MQKIDKNISVGQYGIQLGVASGYKVIATCSPAKSGICIAAGATATLDYKLPLEKQLRKVDEITKGRFVGIFDAGAVSYDAAIEMLTT